VVAAVDNLLQLQEARVVGVELVEELT